jgi:FkbM family methyltransferase
MTDIYTDETLDAMWYAQDDMIVRWLRQNPKRKFEPATTPWMLEQMQARHGAYVDVGASTGWFAVPIAKRGYEVIAFECNARSAQRLRENCELNSVSITLHQVAASDRDGQAAFTHNPRLPLTSGGSLEHVSANRATDIVPCARLDSLVTGPVALLKIDVEGHERAVLAGAERLIETNRPALVLEANTAAHQTVLIEWLMDREYEWVLADERNMLCLPAS